MFRKCKSGRLCETVSCFAPSKEPFFDGSDLVSQHFARKDLSGQGPRVSHETGVLGQNLVWPPLQIAAVKFVLILGHEKLFAKCQ